MAALIPAGALVLNGRDALWLARAARRHVDVARAGGVVVEGDVIRTLDLLEELAREATAMAVAELSEQKRTNENEHGSSREIVELMTCRDVAKLRGTTVRAVELAVTRGRLVPVGRRPLRFDPVVVADYVEGT